MDNSLKKIIADGLASLKNSFSGGGDKKQALGVDIGSSSIKVVQLKKKGGRAVLETYGVISLGPYGGTSVGALTSLKTEDIARALKDVMKESNVTTKSSILSIPSLASLIFLVTLPWTVKESELENIIPIEARKYIPVPISEVTLDWFVIPNEDEMQENDSPSNIKRNREVLVVAIHNETLTQYREILKQTGLESDAFEMEIFSNIRSTFNNELAPFLIVDFGASKTKVSIVESGVVKVFHVVNRGSHDISRNISQALGITFEEAEKLKRMVGLDASVNPEAEKIIRLAANYIFTDINSIVFAYQKKYNKNISKVFLSGGGSLLKGLLEAARENFRVEVFYSNPFSKTEAPAFLEPVLENSGPEFAVAVGLALRQLS